MVKIFLINFSLLTNLLGNRSVVGDISSHPVMDPVMSKTFIGPGLGPPPPPSCTDLHVMPNSNNLLGPDEHLGSEFVAPDEIFPGGNVENIKVLVCDES